MDEIDVGVVTIETVYRYPDVRHRITHAHPHIRLPANYITRAAAGHLAPYAHLDGDHLTLTDDHDQHATYRIHWDNYSSGYLADLVDMAGMAPTPVDVAAPVATTTEVTA